MLFIFYQANEIGDNTPLITEELVDRINNDPKSTFRAFLNPKWAKKTVGDAKKFLSPVRQAPINHGSARPVGYSERVFHNMDKRFLSGTCSHYKHLDPADTTHPDGIDYALPAVHALCDEFNVGKTGPHPINVQEVDGKLPEAGTLYFPVYDVSSLCSSWAPAVTSAMSSSLWRWTPKKSSDTPFNLSLLFILDCDILGDPCVERPPLSAYEQFWRRYIPKSANWDRTNEYSLEQKTGCPPGDKSCGIPKWLRPPSNSLTQEQCNKYNGCYPGVTPTTEDKDTSHSCAREMVLTGVCEPGSSDQSCPIYFLYNWRWMKSHIAEVGPVTSSILVYKTLFAYGAASTENKDIYSATNAAGEMDAGSTILGMLDVTIIGWGQTRINMSSHTSSQAIRNRWWYVIPHFGIGNTGNFNDYSSLKCEAFTEDIAAIKDDTPADIVDAAWQTTVHFKFNGVDCYHTGDKDQLTGVMKFNRRFDDCNIESQAVGAVPHSFVPRPYRSPRPTWSGVWEAVDA